MKNNKINNKILAREILVFFGCIAVVILLWCIPLIKNAYYENEITSAQEKKKIIANQIEQLPSNYNWTLYCAVKKMTSATKAADWFDDKESVQGNIMSFNDFQQQLQNEKYRENIEGILHESIDKNKASKSIGYNNRIAQQIEHLNNTFQDLENIISTATLKLYSDSSMWHYIFICAIIIISIAYGLRYSVISIVWAIRVFRNESKSLSDNPEPMT